MNGVMGDNHIYIYCFGGFDKKAVEAIERVKISFDTTLHHPIVSEKWELLKNVSLD
jgi:hypothetical protein